MFPTVKVHPGELRTLYLVQAVHVFENRALPRSLVPVA